MPKLKVKCPAKINLTLEVLNKRPDGFHNIQSIMQTINLFDILTIDIQESTQFEIKLSGTSNEIPYDERNLVYKAAKLFFEKIFTPHPQPLSHKGRGETPQTEAEYCVCENSRGETPQTEAEYCVCENSEPVALTNTEDINALQKVNDFVPSPLVGEGGWKPDEGFKKLLYERAKVLRNKSTVPEEILWYHLRNRRFCNLKFRRQVPFKQYIADFVCFEKNIIIELDGSEHLTDKNKKYDERRDKFLLNQGFKVLRFYNTDIFNNIENVLERLYMEITPHPQPLSHKGREGLPQTEAKYCVCENRRGETPQMEAEYCVCEYSRGETPQTEAEYCVCENSRGETPQTEAEYCVCENSERVALTNTEDINALQKVNDFVPSPLVGEGGRKPDEGFKKLFGFPTGKQPNYLISIHIEKNIPIAAGLAGGSTDAAGTVWGLNEILNQPLTRGQLHEICAKLGSDLNFCLEGGCQSTTGRGEILKKLPFVEFDVSLIKPKNLGISAKEAYTKFSLLKTKPNLNMTAKFIDALNSGEKDISKYITNDLEFAVIGDYKELKTIKTNVKNSLMSGSGSTFFALTSSIKPIDDSFWIKNGLKSISYGVSERK